MTAFDFDRVTNRRNTGSLKWDVGEQELPMWVADMDFQTAPEILQAMQSRLDHGIFGYSVIPDEWYDAYIGWWEKRHHFKIERNWLVFCTGVIPAISSAVRRLTAVGEKVVIQTPVYNIFVNSIVNNGRHVLENPLLYDGKEYTIDFCDLEAKLADPETTLMILCNPHNPVGKIWDCETLKRIGDLCAKYRVTVLSDEIHCDLTDPGKVYHPFASVSEVCRQNSVTCMAPTKAFNIAGLQTAAVCVPDELLRNRMIRGLNTDEVAEPNAYAVTAAVAAFTKGGEWLDALRQYIYENKQYVCERLSRETAIKVVPSEATYLLWLDCGRITDDGTTLCHRIRELTGLYLSAGEQYGKTGKQFIRMNIACPRSLVNDGLDRLIRTIQ